MKRKLLLAIGLFIVVGICGTASAQAINARSGDTLSVGREEVIDASIYRAGKRVIVAGTVKGDVFCAAQNVEITGVVEGDVLCAAQEVRISGRVDGDIRVAGQNIFLSQAVKGSATIAGQSITIEEGASIGKDATLMGQTTHVAGKVGRDVVSTSDMTTIAATIGRDLEVYGDNTRLTDKSRVGGEFVYTSHNQAQIDKGAVVTGRTDHKTPPEESKARRTAWPGRLMSPLYWVVSLTLIGAVGLLLMPRWFKGATKIMQAQPLGTIGLGLAGLVLTPIVSVGLMVTVVGLPLGIPLLLLWVMAIFASFAFVAYTVGGWLVQRLHWLEKGREFAALLAGVLPLVLLLHIPLVGFWVGLGATLWGIGGIYLAVARSIRAQHSKPSVKARKA